MGFCAFIGGGVTELSVVTFGTGINSQADYQIPAEALPFDIFLGFDRTPAGVVTPAGFTQIASTVNGLSAGISSYRVIQPGDAGATFAGGSGAPTNKRFVLLRPDEEFDTVIIADLLTNSSGSSIPMSQVIPMSGKQTPVAAICMGEYAVTDNSSPAFDGSNLGTYAAVQWTIYNSNPVDQTASWSASRHMHTFSLSVS